MFPFHLLAPAMTKRAKAVRLDAQAVVLLSVVKSSPGASMTTIAAAMDTTPPSVTRCRARIPREYLDVTEPDGRTMAVRLSAEGERVLESLFEEEL